MMNSNDYETSKKFKVVPLDDRVLLERVEAEEKAGSIYIPQTAQDRPTEAVVVATGPGRRNEVGDLVKIDLKEGDRVLFGKFSGTIVKVGGVELTLLRRDEVLAKLELEEEEG